MKSKRTPAAVLWLIAVLAVIGWALPVSGQVVPTPTVIGPIAETAEPGDPGHDYIFFTPKEDLSAYGYVEEEFFLEGEAYRYNTPEGATGSIAGGPR